MPLTIAAATHITKTDVWFVCCSEFEHMAPYQLAIHDHHDCAARCQLLRPLPEFKFRIDCTAEELIILPNDHHPDEFQVDHHQCLDLRV